MIMDIRFFEAYPG